MKAYALLLPLLLVLTACDDVQQQPPATSWLGFVDHNAGWVFLLAIFALVCWRDGRGS